MAEALRCLAVECLVGALGLIVATVLVEVLLRLVGVARTDVVEQLEAHRATRSATPLAKGRATGVRFR